MKEQKYHGYNGDIMTNKTNFMSNFIFAHWTIIIIIIVFTGQQLSQFYFFL